MKRFFTVLACLTVLLTMIPGVQPVAAQSSAPGDETYAGKPLCLPDVYPQTQTDCVLMGPSAQLSQMARIGLTIPPRPVPATKPDPALNDVPVRFARISIDRTEQAAVYATVEEASQGGTPVRYLPAGNLLYITYRQQIDIDGNHYLQLTTGEWMRASPAVYPRFQGLEFHANPTNSVGWIIENVVSRTAPESGAPLSGKEYLREQSVQIYDHAQANKTDWYMIGVDEWVERRYIRELKLNAVPPKGVENNRWIEVNLYEQTLAVYENGRLLFGTLIASGAAPFYTQPGLFKIYKKKPLETMSGAFETDKSDYYYLEDVPWTMYFDEARAIHGAYWRPMFGVPQSHGCVNLSIGDARWVFDWAQEGDWVYVWDPSGKTPTDTKLYTKGGA